MAFGALGVGESGVKPWFLQARIGGHPWLQAVTEVEECCHLLPSAPIRIQRIVHLKRPALQYGHSQRQLFAVERSL
jgi:hypothetical protein